MRLFLAPRANETGSLIIFNGTQELVLYVDYTHAFELLVFIASYQTEIPIFPFVTDATIRKMYSFFYINSNAYKEYIY